MNDRLDSLLSQMRQLERDLIEETKKKETEFFYRFKEGKIQFTEAAKAKHKALKAGFPGYLQRSRFLVVATSPAIWMCALPIALCDVIGTAYQAICFPIYGIPKVRRRDYLAFDRRHLGYLNFAEKFNCEYCAYVNGILAYFTEIAARTEQHWCPIKHAHCATCAHSRYKKFLDYGDAEGYRKNVEAIRRAYGDLSSAAEAPSAPPGTAPVA
jgi:hypothetical protein